MFEYLFSRMQLKYRISYLSIEYLVWYVFGQYYPMQEVLFAPYCMDDYRPELIDMILSLLVPENIR